MQINHRPLSSSSSSSLLKQSIQRFSGDNSRKAQWLGCFITTLLFLLSLFPLSLSFCLRLCWATVGYFHSFFVASIHPCSLWGILPLSKAQLRHFPRSVGRSQDRFNETRFDKRNSCGCKRKGFPLLQVFFVGSFCGFPFRRIIYSPAGI